MLARGFKTRCENISLQIRNELGLGKTDPLPPKALAQYLGVLLWKPTDIPGLSQQTLTVLLEKGKIFWSAVTISYGRVDAIIYNSSHSKARQASDIMHELSHMLLGHTPSQIVLSPNNPFALRSYNENQEEEAAWLAGCLLLPRKALVFIKNKGISDYKACEIYEVSRKLLSYRVNVTGVNYQIQAKEHWS